MHETADGHLARAARRTRGRTAWPAPSPLTGGTAQHAAVPGACPVVQVRASYLTRAHVIRLGANQGTIWQENAWRKEVHPSRRAAAHAIDVRRTWREVLGAYTDRASLEAITDSRLGGDLSGLAEEAWDNRHRAMVIRVLIHEVSDACEIADVFVILNVHDLLDAQPLPAAGMAAEWGAGLSEGLTPGMLNLLVGAAGELWNEMGGRDPYDVLGFPKRAMLDLAAARYRADFDPKTGDGDDLEGADGEVAR